MKVLEYTILADDCPKDLSEQVNANIQEGWQPFGGVACNPPTEQSIEWYAQAMVKYEE